MNRLADTLSLGRARVRVCATLLATAAALALAAPANASVISPEVTFTGGPDGRTNDRTPTFSFRSPDTSSFQCQIDGGAWFSCSSPYTTPPLPNGNHVFAVRGIGLLLLPGEPALRTFSVVEPDSGDTRAPNTRITRGPADGSSVSSDQVTFRFVADEERARFECALDDSAFARCSSPHTLTGLANGPHRFVVRAVDRAGNRDPSPESRSFDVQAQPSGSTCLGLPVTIRGSDGPDQIAGTEGDDVILALDGDDQIEAGGGVDRVCSGPGDDRAVGAGGADRLVGGPGDDHVDGGKHDDELGGGPGKDRVVGAGGDDKLGANVDSDSLAGGEGDDRLNGGGGADRCDGGGGKDKDKKCERVIGVP